MARAASGLIDTIAAGLGAAVAKYSRAALGVSDVLFDAALPRQPVVFIGWHEANALTLVLHGRLLARPAIAFVPPGVNGAAMRGWLEALDIAPVALAPDARRGLGLRQMRSALAEGKDVLIAVDGPNGPRHSVAPGALWLAHASGAEVRPVGCAASLCLRLPRWDRLIVPLPGAHAAAVAGAAWTRAGALASAEALAALATELHSLTRRAQSALKTVPALARKEVLPWP